MLKRGIGADGRDQVPKASHLFRCGLPLLPGVLPWGKQVMADHREVSTVLPVEQGTFLLGDSAAFLTVLNGVVSVSKFEIRIGLLVLGQ